MLENSSANVQPGMFSTKFQWFRALIFTLVRIMDKLLKKKKKGIKKVFLSRLTSRLIENKSSKISIFTKGLLRNTS